MADTFGMGEPPPWAFTGDETRANANDEGIRAIEDDEVAVSDEVALVGCSCVDARMTGYEFKPVGWLIRNRSTGHPGLTYDKNTADEARDSGLEVRMAWVLVAEGE